MERSSYRATFGELFQFSFQTMTKNWMAYLIIAGLSLIPALTMLIGGAPSIMNMVRTEMAMGDIDPMIMMSMMGALITGAVVSILLSIIVSPIISGANLKVIFEVGQNRAVGAMDAIRFGASKWFNLFIAILLTALLGLLPTIAIVIMILIAVFVGMMSTGAGIVLGIASFVGTIAILIVYGIKISFIMPAIVAKEIGFGEALKDSMSMSSNGEFWDVFLKLLLISLAVITINLVISFTIGLIPFLGAIVSTLVSSVLTLLTNNFIMAYYMDRNGLFAETQVTPELGL